MADETGLTVPDARPSIGGAPTLQVRAPPEAFGAVAAGQSLKQAAQSVQQGSEAVFAYAKTFQDLNNKAASDTAGSEFAFEARKAFDTWSLANPGAKALTPNANGVTPMDEFGNQLIQMRSDIAAKHGLSRMASSMYDDQTRRLQALVLGDADSYARTQQHGYWVSASKAAIENYKNQIAARPTDMNFIEGVTKQIAAEALHQQVLTGAPDQEVQNQILDETSAALKVNVANLGTHDPLAADSLLKQYEAKGWISPRDKEELDRTLHSPMAAQIAAQSVDSAYGSVSGAAGDPDATLRAIMHSESGGRNVINYKEARGEKGFTASGYYQITNPTWEQFAGPEVLAQYKRAINAPFEVQTAVAKRILAARGTEPWSASKAGWGPAVAALGAGASATGADRITQIETNLPGIQAQAVQTSSALATEHGIDQSEMEQHVIAASQARYSHEKFTYGQEQSATLASIYSAMETAGPNQGPVSSLNDLYRIPGMQQAVASLTPQDRFQVEQRIGAYANMDTYERRSNMLSLLGMTPQEFVNQNLAQYDLRRTDAIALAKKQITVRNELQKGGDPTQKWLRAALANPNIKINIPQNNQDALKYVGALTTELEDWQAANPGKSPTLNDYNAIGQNLIRQTGGSSIGSWTFGQRPVYQYQGEARAGVPEAFRSQMRAYRAMNGLSPPTEADVEAVWAAQQAAAKR